MKEDIYYFRTKLLLTFAEKGYSQSLKHETMKLFGKLKPELKEKVAEQALEIVQQSKTEKEAYNKIAQLIERI